MAVENKPGAQGGGYALSTLDSLIAWGRKFSLYPFTFATACCGIEVMAGFGTHYDVSRFGAEVIRFSPRQADVLFVAGTINFKMAPVLKRIYDQMLEPKWVVAMGACASSGGFYDNYSVMQGIDRILPVDVYIPGCPPQPEGIIDAIVALQKMIETGAPRVVDQWRAENRI